MKKEKQMFADLGAVYEMPPLVKLNSAYSRYRVDVQEVNNEPSMTRQEMSDECDINQIMARFEKTGMLPANHVARQPLYLDLTMAPPDLMTAMNLMNEADTAFMSLPASVRKEFDNDPMRFVEFASDAANIDAMRGWGLAPPAPVEAPPTRVEIVSDARSPEANKSAGGSAPAD